MLYSVPETRARACAQTSYPPLSDTGSLELVPALVPHEGRQDKEVFRERRGGVALPRTAGVAGAGRPVGHALVRGVVPVSRNTPFRFWFVFSPTDDRDY